jgi:hypothetical protein
MHQIHIIDRVEKEDGSIRRIILKSGSVIVSEDVEDFIVNSKTAFFTEDSQGNLTKVHVVKTANQGKTSMFLRSNRDGVAENNLGSLIPKN